MACIPKVIRHLKQRLLLREDGTATVEAVLWLPIFMAVFGLMVDSAMIFQGQSKVLRVVQDANRKISNYGFKEDSQAEAYIREQLALIGVTPTTATTVSNLTTGMVTTTVVVPAAQLQALGYFSSLVNLQIPLTASHMREDWRA